MAWAARRWWAFTAVAVLLLTVLGWSRIQATEMRREAIDDGAPAPRTVQATGEAQTTGGGLTETRSSEQIVWEAGFGYDLATLEVVGDDVALSLTFAETEPMRLLASEFADGDYSYVLVVGEQPTERVRVPGGIDEDGRTHVFPDSIAQGPPLATQLSGSFTVVRGAIDIVEGS